MIQYLRNNCLLFFAKAWLPTISYCGLIYYLSSHPPHIRMDLFPMQDKVYHVIEFGILSLLFLFSLNRSFPGSNSRVVIMMEILCTGLYGISDEIHQYFVPERVSSIGDVMADFMGAVIFQSRNILKNYSKQ